MAKHEFGIINCFICDKRYDTYEPEKYNCISVNDNLIERIMDKHKKKFEFVKTYNNTKTELSRGLNYCGTNIIPPESLKNFCDIITNANNECQSQEIKLLIEKISEAINENKYLIHYGI